MKTNILITVLLAGLLLSSCRSDNNSNTDSSGIYVDNPEYGIFQEDSAPPFSFELINNIRPEFPDDFILSGINQLLTDPEGNIYFRDTRQSKLISLNNDGTFRWITGQEGRGPGDFENAYSMITDGTQIFIGNLQGSRLDVFSYGGDFEKSYNLTEKVSFGTLWGFLSGGEIVMAAPNWDSWGPHMHIVEITGDTVRTIQDFVVDQSGEIETNQGITSRSSVSEYNDKIYTGSIIDYSIETYDTSGTLIRKIRRDFDQIVRPGMHTDGDSSTLRGFGRVGAPQFLPNEFFVVQASWPTNVDDPDRYVRLSNNGTVPEVEYANSIDIFNPEGQLLYSFEGDGYNPEIGAIAHIDENGIIYTTEMDQDQPVIKKYRLVLNDEYNGRIAW